MTKKYVVTFGQHDYLTEYVYTTKANALKRAKKLKAKYPFIHFNVKKLNEYYAHLPAKYLYESDR
jgi:hypothetical protein